MLTQTYIAQLRKAGVCAEDALEAARFLEQNDMLDDYAITNQPDTSPTWGWDGISPRTTDPWATP